MRRVPSAIVPLPPLVGRRFGLMIHGPVEEVPKSLEADGLSPAPTVLSTPGASPFIGAIRAAPPPSPFVCAAHAQPPWGAVDGAADMPTSWSLASVPPNHLAAVVAAQAHAPAAASSLMSMTVAKRAADKAGAVAHVGGTELPPTRQAPPSCSESRQRWTDTDTDAKRHAPPAATGVVAPPDVAISIPRRPIRASASSGSSGPSSSSTSGASSLTSSSPSPAQLGV